MLFGQSNAQSVEIERREPRCRISRQYSIEERNIPDITRHGPDSVARR
jgi:hypothetical protein